MWWASKHLLLPCSYWMGEYPVCTVLRHIPINNCISTGSAACLYLTNQMCAMSHTIRLGDGCSARAVVIHGMH